MSILDRGVGESSSIGIDVSSSGWVCKGCAAGCCRVKKANVDEAKEVIDLAAGCGGGVERVCGVLVKGIGVETEVFTLIL